MSEDPNSGLCEGLQALGHDWAKLQVWRRQVEHDIEELRESLEMLRGDLDDLQERLDLEKNA